ncbi:kinase A anchor protein [Mycena pura]|uniref:Kinase A anchor protein n=1 Tax=Mycena pura TaxID=153505 RepID=A0AAD6YUB0_9AGAR|nr:kinase A anchor protein [Mycena pura]
MSLSRSWLRVDSEIPHSCHPNYKGQHPELRKRIKDFQQKILCSANEIQGLDQSILVDPRRLHFTIGVMALSTTESPDNPDAPQSRTISEAIALLYSLAPEINQITRQPVLLTLDKMGVLKTKGQQAGVLYVGPSDESSENASKVNLIFNLLTQRFRQEGFISDPFRPAVLHCTLINASHRKPRRIPRAFSYREIFGLATVDTTSAAPADPEQSHQLSASVPSPAPADRAIRVDFGTWLASEIQLCKMGSHGPENEYVSCASIPLGGN